MSKYLLNITSYEDLKNKYRELLKANHPDNGGSLEVMQEINSEYDVLFRIWKDRAAKTFLRCKKADFQKRDAYIPL